MSSHAVLCACVDVDIEEGRRLRLADDNRRLKDINAADRSGEMSGCGVCGWWV